MHINSTDSIIKQCFVLHFTFVETCRNLPSMIHTPWSMTHDQKHPAITSPTAARPSLVSSDDTSDDCDHGDNGDSDDHNDDNDENDDDTIKCEPGELYTLARKRKMVRRDSRWNFVTQVLPSAAFSRLCYGCFSCFSCFLGQFFAVFYGVLTCAVQFLRGFSFFNVCFVLLLLSVFLLFFQIMFLVFSLASFLV